MALLILLVFATICAFVANSKGRNIFGWFFLGFFFPLIAIILLICLPNLNAERDYRLGQDRENRMLREKLLQEQLKLQRFQEHASHRLDEHDKLLKTDTRSGAPPLATLHPKPDGKPLYLPAVIDVDNDKTTDSGANTVEEGWYYAVGNKHCGPVGKMIIEQLIEIGSIQRETLIWNEAWRDWTAAGNTSEFAKCFIA